MKHRIPIIALTLLLASCLQAEPTTQPATQPKAYLVSGEVLRRSVCLDVPVELSAKRDALLAEARAGIRAGLLKLGEQFPQLKRSTEWQRIEAPLQGRPDSLEIQLYHSMPKAPPDPTPQQDRFHVTITIEPPPLPQAKVHLRPLYRHLGLVGIIEIEAGDPQLKAALEKIVGDALAPLNALNQQAAPTQPTTQLAGKTASYPATTTTTTTSAPAVDPAAMAILNRLEAAGNKYPNITAKIDYKVDMLQTGDAESRTGKVYYQRQDKKTSAKFRIHFSSLRQGTGPKIRAVVDYAYDGAWLTVRKERVKQMSRYQVAPPGQKVNPLQLGKGPFPVPFGQKAASVVKHFQPTTRPAAKTDPKNTDYIKLTTRRQYRKDFSIVWLEMWIDRKTSLPVKIVADDRSENRTTVIFKDIKTPKAFPKKTFDLPRPPAGWEYHVEKYKGRIKP